MTTLSEMAEIFANQWSQTMEWFGIAGLIINEVIKYAIVGASVVVIAWASIKVTKFGIEIYESRRNGSMLNQKNK